MWLSMVSYIPIAGSHDARNATGATSFPSQVCVHEKIGGAHPGGWRTTLREHLITNACMFAKIASDHGRARIS